MKNNFYKILIIVVVVALMSATGHNNWIGSIGGTTYVRSNLNVAGTDLLVYNPNQFLKDTANIYDRKFPMPTGETANCYAGNAVRLGNSDTLIGVAKGDGAALLYSFISTDGGQTFTYVDTVIQKNTQSWHSARIVEGMLYYQNGNDTIHLIYKGYNNVVFQMGHAWALRSDPTNFTDDAANPVITDAQTEADLGFSVGDMGPSCVITYNDSIYVLGGISSGSPAHYSICLWSGKTPATLRAKQIIAEPNKKYLNAFGATVYRDADSNWYMMYTQGKANTNDGWYIKTRTGKSLYDMHDVPGRFMEPDISYWNGKSTYGPQMFKKWDGQNFVFPDDKNEYWMFFCSGVQYGTPDFDRTSWFKIYPHQYDGDSTVKNTIDFHVRPYQGIGVNTILLGYGNSTYQWDSTFHNIQGDNGQNAIAFSPSAGNGTHWVCNTYFNGTNWKYISNNKAIQQDLYEDGYLLRYAGSGTAGNNISFSNGITLAITTGFVGIGVGLGSATSKLDINATNGYAQLRLRTSYTPSGTADANGNIGDMAWDADYWYVKTAAGWKRAALSTF